MSSASTKQPKGEPLASKSKHFLLSAIRYLVSATRDYLRFRFLLIIIPLLILIIMGKLLTKDGLFVILFIIGCIVLDYLYKWLEKHKEK